MSCKSVTTPRFLIVRMDQMDRIRMDQTQEVKKEIKKVDVMMMGNRGPKCGRTEERKSASGPSLLQSLLFSDRPGMLMPITHLKCNECVLSFLVQM